MLTDEALSSTTGDVVAIEEVDSLLDTLDLPRCVHQDEIELLINMVDERDRTDYKSITDRFSKLLDIYLQQPFLIDPHLAHWSPKLISMLHTTIKVGVEAEKDRIECICSCIYAFCKVRGEKPIIVYFEHQIDDVVPVLLFLRQSMSMDWSSNHNGWMVKYVATLMGAIVLLIPFDLSQLKKRIVEGGSADLIDRVIEGVSEKLKDSGRERQSAVIFISSLYKRRDYIAEIPKFIESTISLLITEPSLSMGHIQCVIKIIESTPTEQFSTELKRLIESLNNCPYIAKSSLLRKLRLKLLNRVSNEVEPEVRLQTHLTSLSDSDTIVRSSAAKGLCKIAKSLTIESHVALIQTLCDTLYRNLAMAFPDVNICHGIALSLAELIKAGFVPLDKLSLIIGCARELLTFEVPRGRYSAGAAVRDSACYVIWAMVRSYGCVETHLIEQLAESLICSALFDREVSCRRAAAAAFQELVGRWEGVPDGVELLQHINFFNVNQRRVTFEEVVGCITEKSDRHRSFILTYLTQRCINSWDREIRRLSSVLVAKLMRSDDDLHYIIDQLTNNATNLDDLASQHGSILTLAAIFHKLKITDEDIWDRQCNISCMLIDSIPPKMLGWELIAEAICRLITSLASNQGCNVNNDVLDKWLLSASAALCSRDDSLHVLVVNELLPSIIQNQPSGSATITTYFRTVVLPTADKDRNLNAQRGNTLAIGAMPLWLFVDRYVPLNKLLTKIIKTTLVIEKRVNAVKSLGALHRELFKSAQCAIPDEQAYQESIETMLGALKDYTVDSRGDIGSVVRLAAMTEAPNLLNHMIIGRQYFHQYIGILLLHLVDKLDKLRLVAIRLLSTYCEGPSLPWKELEESVFNPREFFNTITPFSSELLRDHSDEVIVGLISSAGSVNLIIVNF